MTSRRLLPRDEPPAWRRLKRARRPTLITPAPALAPRPDLPPPSAPSLRPASLLSPNVLR